VNLVSDISTTELVALGAAGDQRAWDQLVDRYTRLVWHVILGFRLSEQSAEDVHQTTWLRLAEKLDSIREPEHLGSWLATTARNECLRIVRHQEREVASEIAEEQLGGSDPLDRHMLESERDVALWGAFVTIPESCQQLLRLLLAEPAFNYEEIAAVLEMPVGSIGPTRSRCLEKLRQHPDLAAMEYPS